MAISTQDLMKVLDLSGQTNISGTDIDQIIDTGRVYSDKGLVMASLDVAGVPDVPNAATTTKWAYYLWLRVGASAVNLYLWNPNAAVDATYLKWQPVNLPNIPAGSITNNALAGGITDDKIIALAFSKLTGVPTWFSGGLGSIAAGGDLLGSNFPAPVLAINTVTTAKIADYNITPSKLSLGAFFYLGVAGGSADVMTVVFAGTIAYSAGVIFIVKAIGPNTSTTPTINIGGTGAITLLNNDGGILPAGSIQSGDFLIIEMIDAANARILNPSHKVFRTAGISITDANFPASTIKDFGAHSLGATPNKVTAYIRCTSVDLGFAVGDTLQLVDALDRNGGNNNGSWMGLMSDSTKIYGLNLRVPITNLAVRRKDATIGTYTAIASAKWDLFVEASM